jgi:hypothetical protein
MSYHILHQFDEQWFADNVQEDDSPSDRLFGALNDPQTRQGSGHGSTPARCWLIVIAALLVASCALYFALDARHHANDLQQRLSELETKLKK